MENHIKEALEIVRAWASVRVMTEGEIMVMARKLSQGIRSLYESAGGIVEEEAALDPRKASKENPSSAWSVARVFASSPGSI